MKIVKIIILCHLYFQTKKKIQKLENVKIQRLSNLIEIEKNSHEADKVDIIEINEEHLLKIVIKCWK